MPEQLFSLTRQQLGRMVRRLVRDEMSPREDLPTRPGNHFDAVEHLAGTAYGTIAARVGAVPGTGYVQAKKFESGTAADYADTAGNLVPVLNYAAAIADGSYVLCHRHRESGKWSVSIPSGGNNSSTPPQSRLLSAYNSTGVALGPSDTENIEFDTPTVDLGDVATHSSSVFTIGITGPIVIQVHLNLTRSGGTPSEPLSAGCNLYYNDGGGYDLVFSRQIDWPFVTAPLGDANKFAVLRHTVEAVAGDLFQVQVSHVSGTVDEFTVVGADVGPGALYAASYVDVWAVNPLDAT